MAPKKNQLNKQQVAETLQPYAATGASWWLTPRYDQNAGGQWQRNADLVIELADGQRIQHSMHAVTYPSLVISLSRLGSDFLPVPHLEGHSYDDYDQVEPLREEVNALWEEGAAEVTKFVESMYALDDTPGVPLSVATEWWKRAEEVLAESRWDELAQMPARVGPPHFENHTGQLRDLLQVCRLGLTNIGRFLRDNPVPTIIANHSGLVTTGDGKRYPHRKLYQNGDFDYRYKIFKYNARPEPWEIEENDGMASEEFMQVSVSVWESLRQELLDMRQQLDRMLSTMGQIQDES